MEREISWPFLKRWEAICTLPHCVVLARFNKCLAKMMLVVVTPVCSHHGRAQKMFATRSGGAERQIAMTSGEWIGELVT